MERIRPLFTRKNVIITGSVLIVGGILLSSFVNAYDKRYGVQSGTSLPPRAGLTGDATTSPDASFAGAGGTLTGTVAAPPAEDTSDPWCNPWSSTLRVPKDFHYSAGEPPELNEVRCVGGNWWLVQNPGGGLPPRYVRGPSRAGH